MPKNLFEKEYPVIELDYIIGDVQDDLQIAANHLANNFSAHDAEARELLDRVIKAQVSLKLSADFLARLQAENKRFDAEPHTITALVDLK